MVVPAEITIFEDRSFTFITKTPPRRSLISRPPGSRRARRPLARRRRARSPGAGARDRGDQDARPQRDRPRRRDGARSRAPRVRWASTSSAERPLHNARSRSDLAAEITGSRGSDPRRDDMAQAARSTSTPTVGSTASQLHAPDEAMELVKTLATRNFDETVEVAFRLGVDPRKADQMVRGTVALPHGTGKDVRIAVFADGDAARDAEAAGADVVGADDLVTRIQDGFLDFDVADRDARPDGPGRQARPGARPAWADAEPEDRHRHDRRRQGGRASSRAARSSTAPTVTATCTCRSARSSFETDALVDELPGRARRDACGPSRPRPRAATSGRSRCRRRWARASRSTPAAH